MALLATVSAFGVLLATQAGAVSNAVTISIADASTPEGGPENQDHFVTVPVTLSAASPDVVTVNWRTVDGTAKSFTGPDDPSGDYYAGNGTLTFTPGDTSENVDVLIDGGSSPEPNETFTIELSSPTNATLERGVATVTILNDDVPPPPEPGEVNVLPAGGGGQCVAVKDGGGCKPLEAGTQIEIDDVLYVNPRGSRVTVESIAGITTFYGGRFDIAEIGADSDKPIVVLRLVGGNLKAKCGTASRATAGLSAQAKKTPVRRLWGKGKGRFRTRGRYSSGTVRGTNWLTIDYCDGTYTRVVAGVVRVYDLVTKKWIVLKAGESYFAEAGPIS
ncbi:MAG TPA: Calx-beta domain-containing protein [Gaiellaceae bacterium]|nr:Calx-beta domain-containing protein [Gaiellaceae bacterium]